MRKVHLVVLDMRAPQAGHPGDLGCVMGKEASELADRVVTQRDIAQEGSAHDHVVSAGGDALGDEQPGDEVANPQMQSALCLERRRCPVLWRPTLAPKLVPGTAPWGRCGRLRLAATPRSRPPAAAEMA